MELRRDRLGPRGTALGAGLALFVEVVSAAIDVLLLPSLILAFFVAELTPSYTTIGLVPAVAAAFWALGRVPALLLLGGRRRMKAWAFGAATTRAGAILVLGVLVIRTDPSSLATAARPLLGVFFLCFVAYALAGGFGSVAQERVVRTAVPGAGWDGFVVRRAVWSAVLGLLGALVVARILGSGGFLFPGNFGRLFLVAALSLIAVAAVIAAVREQVGAFAVSDAGFAVRTWRGVLASRRIRQLLVFQVLLAVGAAIDPFLLLYAVTRLGLPVTTIGTYTIAAAAGWILFAPIWMALERRSGPRGVLQGAAVIRLIAPAVALVVPQLAATEQLRAAQGPFSSLGTIYALAFFAIGASLAGQSRALHTYATAVAPPALARPTIGLINAVLVVVAFAPVVGGTIIQRYGYEVLFVVAAVVGLAAVLASGRLAETLANPRGSVIPSQGSTTYAALSAGRG